MKILYIHNNYKGDNSGEEHAAEGLVRLLEQHGHTVEWYRRSSSELSGSKLKEIKALFSGIWNPFAVRAVKKKLKTFQPDIVQVQNLYPLISPAIIPAIKKAGIPLVMRCPNYRLFCAGGLFLDKQGTVCEVCTSGFRELYGITNNCEKSFFKSSGYALRNFAARRIWGLYTRVDNYIVQSEFQKKKFIANGIDGSKISILPGLTPELSNLSNSSNGTRDIPIYRDSGNYVSFVGRVSVEKGIEEFLAAARTLPEIPFAVVGKLESELEYLKQKSPENVLWTGYLKGQDLDNFYASSRMIVVPGKWYEGFPNVITRAMKHAKPVITSRLGAMASIIDHEENGLLVEPGNAGDLAKSIEYLYNQPELCRKLGENGRKKAEEQYSSELIYKKLMEVYESVKRPPNPLLGA